ncbi:DNA gyrase subunit A [Candidatus Poribacteria bacterium]|nr:DNA gyrase subunit A [Candidatus Poribacteria bacterium]
MLTRNDENQKIITRYIEDELRESYLTYAMSVNTNRAIPDVRDGMKPSTRRIIYAMGEMNLTSGRPYDKCAAVVGEVMKNYHPHGDGPIYDTMVGMVQDFSMRYPLIDGQGNFGSIDDDPPGAMRYTECRLAAIADEMLADVHKNTVDFQPNYKDSINEPTVLPARLPNLIVNGTTGIGVGYLTRIPPHNLSEVVDGLILLLENPGASIQELMKCIPGPDFPTAGLIVGRSGIRDMYIKGKGSVTVRAKAVIERTKGRGLTERSGKEHILITEIPYQIKKNNLLEKMYDLVANKTITGISDIRDESDRNIRVLVELKRGEIAQVILNQLYKHTQMQTNYSANMLCLVDGLPKVLSLKEILQAHLDHRREVIRRRTQFDLDLCERRAHILEGYRIALNNIEGVIEIVQTADSPQDARDALVTNYALSEIQANEILTMTLRQLTGLERQKINNEYADLIERIEELRTILESEILITNIIKEELLALKAKHGDERRTEIIDEAKEFEIEDLIADEEMVVMISHEGYIKRMPITTYHRQHRGGIGVIGMGTKEGDFLEHLFVASAHQYILFFTDRGKCYWLKVFEIPEGSRTASGRAIVNLLRVENDEKITAFVPVREFDENRFVFMATEKGVVKKCSLDVFSNPYSAGIIAINLDEGDKLIGAQLTEGEHHIILVTKSGLSIRFSETDVRSMGRTAMGVRGIRLADADGVVGMVVATVQVEDSRNGEDPHPPIDENQTLLIVTENGYGKRTALEEYRLQGRGGKGVITIKTTTRNGVVVAVKMVSDGDELIVISSNGMVTRMAVNDIRAIGRNTQGVRLMSLHTDETVVDVGKITESDEE